MAYNFNHLYKSLVPLMKHTLDVYRSEVVTDTDTGISKEVYSKVLEQIPAYITQSIRAPYLAINNDDTLRVTSYFNVHVKYDITLQTGDYIVGFRDDGEQIAHGYLGEVRYGTALNRALVNIDDTKAQNPPGDGDAPTW